ncbi:MAG: YDG domain-containing protein [Clostridiaceae bacterium]
MKKHLFAIFLFTFALILLIGQFCVASATDLNTELMTNGGAESGNISGWTDDTGAGRWSASTTYSTWAAPAAGSYYFFLYNPSMDTPLSGTMSQEIALTDTNGLFSSISGGNVSINFSISMFQGINADNEAKAILEEYDAGGTLLKTSQVVNTTSTGAMGSYQINTQVQSNTRKFKVILSATLTKGGYAQFDKVSLQLVDASTGSAPVFGNDFPTSPETDASVTYGPINFTISDADAGDVNNLTFSSSSTNINLVPVSNITIGGSDAERTLTIVPAGNLSGEADITVSASDGSKSAEKTFHFIVHKVISMGTNLVENGNAISGYASWSGSTVNVTATGNGFALISPGAGMYQNLDISKFSGLIDSGETQFNMSASFDATYGVVRAQFYTDIACTNPVGSVFTVNSGTTSLQQYIPANAKGVQITMIYTSTVYSTVTVRNISFRIINDFPKITSISDKTTNLSALTVPVYAYYTTASATLTATSGDQTIVPNSGFTYGGSGFHRTVTFTPLKNGTVTITVTLNDGTGSASKSFNVTAVEPAVISSVDSPAAGYYTSGDPLDFTVHFNHGITGGTTSALPLTVGGIPASASYLSSSADSISITYRYTIASGDAGTVAVGTPIDDSSSPITDTAGFGADMRINAFITGVMVVQAPQVTSSSASVTYGDKITFSATLSCADSLTGTVQFKANGNNIGSPVAVSGNAASYEAGETTLDAGSASITAEFVPSGSNSYFTSLTSSACTVTVLPKPVSVSGFTADAKIYDGATAVTLSGGSLTGVLTGDDLSAVYPTAGTAAEKNVGTRSVTFTAIMLDGSDKNNYVLSVQPSVSVVISPKAVTATVTVSSKTYDGNTNAAVNCGFNTGDIVTGDAVTVSATGAFDNKDAETGKTVTIGGVMKSGTGKDNYNITVPTSGSADINPLAITITPDAVTKTYGQDDPAFTYKVTSGALVASETLAGNLTRAAGEDVNQYEITQGTVTSESNPNYNITFTGGVKLTITQATPVVTVSADKASQMTGKDVVVTVTVTYPNKKDTDAYPATVLITPVNASAKDSITVSGNQYSQAFTMGSDLAMPAAFSASVAVNGNYAGAGSTTPATVAIVDRYTPAVSVTSDKGSSATYGDTVTFTATVSDPNGVPQGTVQFYVDASAYGGEVTLASDGTASLSLVAAAPLTAGNRSVMARYTPAADETDYKTNTSGAFSLTVNQKPVSITGLSAFARDYDGTVNVVLTGGTISGMLDGAALTANIPTAGTIPDKNAGTRPVIFTTIVLSGADKDNYVLSVQPTVSVVISPKAVTATVTVSSKNYDGNTNTAVNCGFNTGDIVTGDTVTVSATGAFDNKDAGTGKTVIIGSVMKSGTGKDNYNITVPTSSSANINPLEITITPDAVTKTYGQDDPAFTYKVTSGALVASETLAGGLKRDSGENVGTYEIKPDDALNDTNNPNYKITFNPAKVYLTVSQATPVVTVTSNKTDPAYGDTVTFTATAQKSGSGEFPTGSVQFLIDGTPKGTVALTGGTASYTTTQTELLPGSKNVTAVYTPDTGEKNYSANTSAAYSITVAKREVTVKADGKTIYVGTAIPAVGTLTYTVTGLIGSDALATLPTLSLPADADSGKAADYTISITGAAVSGNYTLKMVNGILHVTEAPDDSSYTSPQTSNTVVAPATTQTDGIAATSVTTGQISQAATVALQEAAQEGTSAIVEIKVQGADHADAVAVTVPKTAVDSLTESGLDGLRLNTSVGMLTFDANALSAMSRSAGENINLKMEALDHTELSDAVREAVGDRPVFDFTITSGDKTISSFGGGNVTVSIPYTLKEGEDPDAIVVYYIDDAGNLTPVHSRYNTETGAAVFTVTHFSRYAIGYNKTTFYDVSKGAWYYNAVTFCAAREITKGIGNSMFDPDATLTRGQFIVFLMRAYGLAPDENPVDNFTDAGNTYYTGYLASAKRLGITNGAGHNMFMPEEVITRQDMFTMLYRALDVLKGLPENDSATSLSDFSDANEISDYAIEAVKRFAAMGIISGSGDNLDPLGCATRAQMAQVLYKLLSK